MADGNRPIIVVTGATGRQGRAVVRHLLQANWHVCALTRNPQRPAAQALATLGAQVVHGDMENPASLTAAFQGAYGIYSLQTPYPHGATAEIRQGIHVARAAKAAGVQHLVYAAAGVGSQPTGIPSWESKRVIAAAIQHLGVPLTIVRPLALMELMTDPGFFPAITTWQIMPAVIGPDRPLGWICTEDVGAIVASVFAQPGRFIGHDLTLVSDVQSLAACRHIYQQVRGRLPRRVPLPPWVFARFGFIGRDLITMWRWLRTNSLVIEVESTRALHPAAHSVATWLRTGGPAGNTKQ